MQAKRKDTLLGFVSTRPKYFLVKIPMFERNIQAVFKFFH